MFTWGISRTQIAGHCLTQAIAFGQKYPGWAACASTERVTRTGQTGSMARHDYILVSKSSLSELIYQCPEFLLESSFFLLTCLTIIKFKLSIPQNLSSALNHTLYAFVVVSNMLFNKLIGLAVEFTHILLFQFTDLCGSIVDMISDIVYGFLNCLFGNIFEMGLRHNDLHMFEHLLVLSVLYFSDLMCSQPGLLYSQSERTVCIGCVESVKHCKTIGQTKTHQQFFTRFGPNQNDLSLSETNLIKLLTYYTKNPNYRRRLQVNLCNSYKMKGPNRGEQLHNTADDFDPLNPWKGLISPGNLKPEDEPTIKPIEYCEQDMLWSSYMANPKFKDEQQPQLEPAKTPQDPNNGLDQFAKDLLKPTGPFCNLPSPQIPNLIGEFGNFGIFNAPELPKQKPLKKQQPQALSLDYPQLTELRPPVHQAPKSRLQIRKLEENFLQPPSDNNWFNQLKKLHCSKLLDPQNSNNMQQFLNQQVSYLEPSPLQKKLEELRRKGERFVDQTFPANNRSLTGEWRYIKKWKDVKWQKISDIIKNPVIFDHKVEPSDIKQGQLGDCYFLAALSALADRPERIFNLFLVLQENTQKYYACKIMYKGKWKTIDLDEYIPTLNGKPAFSKATGQQLWVILLQKAWAKLYSSYKRIQAGYGEEGIHNLTGAHMHAVRLQQSDFDKQAEWKYLMRATRKGFCMIASTKSGSDTECFPSGIVKGHAYTFVGVYEVEYQGSIRRLVKLRNPWGKCESVVAWSDKDGRWNYVSSQEKKRIGYHKDAADGMFFILYDDFLKDFRIINIAEINDSASYVYHTQFPQRRKGCYFKLIIYKQGDYSLQINQTPDRAYEYRHQQNYKYQAITLLLGRVSGNQIEYFEGSQSAYRTLFKKHRLPPGEYIVFAKIMFDQRYQMDYEVTLAVYGDYVCEVNTCPPQEIGNFKEKLFMNRARRMKGKEILPGIWTQQEILREGYIYFACWNRSGQDAVLSISVMKNSNPTVYIKKPYKGRKEIEIPLRHKEDAMVLARIPSFTYATQGIGKARVHLRSR